VTTDTDLARELTDVVLAIEGVQEVYAAGTLARDSLVLVTRSGGRAEVRANVCVLADHPVPATLRAVSQAISAHLASAADDYSVTVKASRIQ